jgi:MFS family permease
MVDRSGRRRLLLAGAGLFAVMIAAHLLVHQLWVLIVVRLLLGWPSRCTSWPDLLRWPILLLPDELGRR